MKKITLLLYVTVTFCNLYLQAAQLLVGVDGGIATFSDNFDDATAVEVRWRLRLVKDL